MTFSTPGHLVAAAIAALSLLAAPGASADITRDCDATISIFQDWNKQTITLAEVQGRGTCKNKLSANACRSGARGQITTCLSDLWAQRQTHKVPASCKNLTAGRRGARLTWEGIVANLPHGSDSLKDRIEHYACCSTPPPGNNGTVYVGWTVVGDKGCAGTKTGNNRYQDDGAIWPNYGVNCTALRAQGLCGG